MKIKKIFKSRAFKALDLPLLATIAAIIFNLIQGKEIVISKVYPYYLIGIFIAWAIRYLLLRHESIRNKML